MPFVNGRFIPNDLTGLTGDALERALKQRGIGAMTDRATSSARTDEIRRIAENRELERQKSTVMADAAGKLYGPASQFAAIGAAYRRAGEEAVQAATQPVVREAFGTDPATGKRVDPRREQAGGSVTERLAAAQEDPMQAAQRRAVRTVEIAQRLGNERREADAMRLSGNGRLAAQKASMRGALPEDARVIGKMRDGLALSPEEYRQMETLAGVGKSETERRAEIETALSAGRELSADQRQFATVLEARNAQAQRRTLTAAQAKALKEYEASQKAGPGQRAVRNMALEGLTAVQASAQKAEAAGAERLTGKKYGSVDEFVAAVDAAVTEADGPGYLVARQRLRQNIPAELVERDKTLATAEAKDALERRLADESRADRLIATKYADATPEQKADIKRRMVSGDTTDPYASYFAQQKERDLRLEDIEARRKQTQGENAMAEGAPQFDDPAYRDAVRSLTGANDAIMDAVTAEPPAPVVGEALFSRGSADELRRIADQTVRYVYEQGMTMDQAARQSLSDLSDDEGAGDDTPRYENEAGRVELLRAVYSEAQNTLKTRLNAQAATQLQGKLTRDKAEIDALVKTQREAAVPVATFDATIANAVRTAPSGLAGVDVRDLARQDVEDMVASRFGVSDLTADAVGAIDAWMAGAPVRQQRFAALNDLLEQRLAQYDAAATRWENADAAKAVELEEKQAEQFIQAEADYDTRFGTGAYEQFAMKGGTSVKNENGQQIHFWSQKDAEGYRNLMATGTEKQRQWYLRNLRQTDGAFGRPAAAGEGAVGTRKVRSVIDGFALKDENAVTQFLPSDAVADMRKWRDTYITQGSEWTKDAEDVSKTGSRVGPNKIELPDTVKVMGVDGKAYITPEVRQLLADAVDRDTPLADRALHLAAAYTLAHAQKEDNLKVMYTSLVPTTGVIREDSVAYQYHGIMQELGLADETTNAVRPSVALQLIKAKIESMSDVERDVLRTRVLTTLNDNMRQIDRLVESAPVNVKKIGTQWSALNVPIPPEVQEDMAALRVFTHEIRKMLDIGQITLGDEELLGGGLVL